MNIANILSKLPSLKLFLTNISKNKNKPSIIVITETHLHEKQNHGYTNLQLQNIIEGYQFFYRNRKYKQNGGIGVFIADEIVDKVKIDLDT